MRSITKEDVARAFVVGVDIRPEYAPLALLRLVELVTELQARVAQLEAEHAPKPLVQRLVMALRSETARGA